MSKKTQQKAIAKLETLYAQLPHVACQGLCYPACGPLPMTTLESDRMRRADPQRRLPMIRDDASCGYLTAGHRCGIYAARPLICRVFGIVKNLSCMHGCVPDRWLSTHEFLAIAKAVERVGGPLVFSTYGGLDSARQDTFLDIDPSKGGISRFDVDRCADLTRGLRAIHGGRILAVTPGRGEWFDLDAKE